MSRVKFKLWLGVTAGLTVIVVILPSIFLFSLAYSKATNIYVESVFCESTTMCATTDPQKRVHLVYLLDNSLIYEERTLNDKIHNSKILASNLTEAITNLDIAFFLDKVRILYEKNGNIFYDSLDQQIDFGLGNGANFILLNNEIYISFLKDSNLYISSVLTRVDQLIVQATNYYSLNTFNENHYFVYEKLGNIYTRTLFSSGLWSDGQIIAEGRNSHFIRNDNFSYILHLNQYEQLRVYYGPDENFVMEQTVTNVPISDLIINQNIIAFKSEDYIYCQKLSDDGFSEAIKIAKGSMPQILHSISTGILYARDGFYYKQFIIFPFEDTTILPTLDVVNNPQDTHVRQARDYINAYYGIPQSDTELQFLSWFSEHPFESFLLLFIMGFVITLFMTTWLVYKKPRNKKKKRTKT